MTLATRCPACGTIFRVVQDQLRVSQGWVRCGRCGEAFNALESMVDLPAPRVPMPAQVGAQERATGLSPPAVVGAPAAASVATFESAPASPMAPSAAAESVAFATPITTDSAPDAASSVPMIEVPPGMTLIASDGAVAAEWVPSHATPPLEAADPQEACAPPSPLAATDADSAQEPPPAAASRASDDEADVHVAPVVAPSFVVRADRAARWSRPGVRAALSLGVVLGTFALLGQATFHFRDRVAATLPALRPWLAQACQVLDCRVGDYRQIDALSVESTGLVRVEGSSVYRLAVTLRNRAAIEVAAPAIDLALNDAQGRPIARRVLQMTDLDLPLRTLRPGSELPILVPLGIGDRQVAGYTVEIFYP